MILARAHSARLASVATAMPANAIDHDSAIFALQRLFPEEKAAFVDNIVRRSGVDTRYSVSSMEQILNGDGDFGARNERYHIAALELAQAAAEKALLRANLRADEIDLIIDVSCTGIAIPALDVALSSRLGLRPDTRRIPITEAGCAAGALAIGMAANFAAQGLRVLVVAVETCTLSLCRGDASRTNLVASVLFGDGAGAAVVLPHGPGPELRAIASHLIPDTRHTMGFDIGSHGMQIRLERELPGLLRDNLPGAIERFLTSHGRSKGDIGLHIVHPGGRKILEAYEDLFELGRGGLAHSREALRKYGNLSSASLLCVLEEACEAAIELPEGQEALMVGVGPGLSLEFSIMGWNELPNWVHELHTTGAKA
ncbi:MAG: alkylresorcinol/alkylpyrone synthase [Planctomycetota bacterium]|jgi:alkylresorcinol/alkylpyrone synthase